MKFYKKTNFYTKNFYIYTLNLLLNLYIVRLKLALITAKNKSWWIIYHMEAISFNKYVL